MKPAVELYAGKATKEGSSAILLMALTDTQGDGSQDSFDDVYKKFSEAQKAVGGFLEFENVEDEAIWPPVVKITFRNQLRKGYAATIPMDGKDADQCMQRLQALGYELM